MLQGIEIKNINHLGIVAGIIDELDIVNIINQELVRDEQEIVNSGEIVKAIILNGLGFVSQPLYLFPKFFEDKATEHLLGNGIKPEHLNEHKIGRVMDKLYQYGLSELFLLIALAAAQKYQINLDYSHLDSSSFSVHGQYNQVISKQSESQLKEVERGFAFLKDPLFFADSVFLKSSRRIETMAMLMGLCLMVYSLGQREVRRQLSSAKTGIPNQLGSLTDRPTLRWIFQCFQGIHLLVHQGIKQVVNLTEERQLTLKFFPLSCQEYYLLSG